MTDASGHLSSKTRLPRWLPGTLRWLAGAFLVLAFAGIVLAPLGMGSSVIERLTHLRLYWLAGLVFLLAGSLARRALWPALITGALLAAGLPGVVRYYRAPPPPSAPDPERTLTVTSWNVWSTNPAPQSGLAWLAQCPADVVLLTEINPAWDKRLRTATARWPHQIRETRSGTAGIWLLSRWPLDPPDPRGVSPAEAHPWIHTVAHTPHGDVRLLGLHPRTPRGGARFDQRNTILDLAAGIAARSAEPVILFGDLNCTPFSPWFSRLLTSGHLSDSALGFGLTPTWQRGIWRLPIDHILTRGLTTTGRMVNPDPFHSDHLPLSATLAWPGNQRVPGA